MIWFGSSAGVALSNQHPEAKLVGLWLRHGWYVAVAYVVGFFAMLALVGWNSGNALMSIVGQQPTLSRSSFGQT
jgi:hypothetical protein